MATTAAAMEAPVVMIYTFEVAKGQEEEFVAGWKQVNDVVSKQEGYNSTKLHQSLSADAPYRFVNVAQWQTPQHWEAAVGSDAFRQIGPRVMSMSQGTRPFLYHVVAE